MTGKPAEIVIEALKVSIGGPGNTLLRKDLI
jgi:hypothetical protein